MKRYIIQIAYLFLFTSSVHAKIWHVPDSALTIQSAINSAINGDTVLVADGLYYENISFIGKQITVASHFLIDQNASHISNTIIDGSRPSLRKYGSVVYFISGEDSNSRLIGFTITGGTGTMIDPLELNLKKGGGGIFILESGATIEHTFITENSIDDIDFGAGGGVFYYSNDKRRILVFQDNSVINNTVTSDSLAAGGGMALYGTSFVNFNTISHNLTRSGVEAAGGGLVNWNLGNDVNYEFQMQHNLISDNQLYAHNTAWGVGCAVMMLGESSLIFNNSIIGNINWEPNSLGGGLTVLFSYPFLISGNTVRDNSAYFGGGLALWYTSPLIRNNLIIENAAEHGSGVFVNKSPWNYLVMDNSSTMATVLKKFNDTFKSLRKLTKPMNPSQSTTDAFFINNTIVKNSAKTQGAAVLSTYGVTRLENSIIRDNKSLDHLEIDGEFLVRYSNIEGGYDGEGNIDSDPLFSDSIHYYLTPDLSPCIDSGNPVAVYNDLADPAAPGMALSPSRGTTINDIGAYGGDPMSREIDHTFLGSSFRSFVDRVMNEPIYLRSSIVDSFMAEVTAFPFIDGNNVVYFLYRGGANSVTIPGDMNSWQQNALPMTRLSGTDLFYRQEVFESDARLDYKFVVNGSSWILDPLNEHTMAGGFGSNSELAMPEYVRGPEIAYYPDIPHGSIAEKTLYSTYLKNSRKVRIYLPAEYGDNPAKSYPIMVFHDGQEYLSIADAKNIIDYLIAHDRIVPIIGVFIPPVNRNEEYAFSQQEDYTKFIIEEVMAMVDTTYRTESDPSMRGMTGVSFGGLISTYICYHHPEQFGLCAPCSPAYWPVDYEVYLEFYRGPWKDLKIYMDWGTYETDLMVDGRTMVQELSAKGYQLKWNEWHEGHSWGNWREHLDIVLEYFFASPTQVSSEIRTSAIPDKFSLSQNYPNPFNSSCVIAFDLPIEDQTTLSIYNVSGQLVKRVLDESHLMAGSYKFDWDGTDISGIPVSSGLYFCKLTTSRFSESKKMLVLR